jgi:diguanylate cyclase (GGDEF)-like protein/PAS domain S-box-containing protein
MDPERLAELAGEVPWTFTNPAVDRMILHGFAESPAGGPDAVVALLDRDGRVLSVDPADPSGGVEPGSGWQSALAGKAVIETPRAGEEPPRLRYVVPVRSGDATVAVLMICQELHTSTANKLSQSAGTLGFGEGGVNAVDRNGLVISSWDPSRVGTHLVDGSQLMGDWSGPRRLESTDDRVLFAAPIASTEHPDPMYLVFEQPTSALFGDIRAGQTARTLALVAILAIAIALLVQSNWRREQAARASRRRLDALLHNAHDIITVLDDQGRPTFVSSPVEGLLGFGPAEATKDTFTEVIHPHDRSRVLVLVAEARSLGTASAADVRLRTAAGAYRWFDVEATDLSSVPEIAGLLLTCHEVSERRALQDQLAYQATHDDLTGLANRAVFVERLEQLADAPNPPGFAVLFVDLDDFKAINDHLGHDIGDQVLQVAAGRIEHSVRQRDGRDSDLVCRLGGDEFAIMLMQATDEGARRAAERIRHELRQPVCLGGREIEIDATVGVAFAQPGVRHPELVLRHADQAMYEAKRAGRGRCRTYSGGS